MKHIFFHGNQLWLCFYLKINQNVYEQKFLFIFLYIYNKINFLQIFFSIPWKHLEKFLANISNFFKHSKLFSKKPCV